MIFANGKEEIGPYYYYYYYYYYYFQMSNILRRSCYSCKRVFHEVADITIGDFGVFIPIDRKIRMRKGSP